MTTSRGRPITSGRDTAGYGEEDVMEIYQSKGIHDENIIQRDDRGAPWNIPARRAISADGCSSTGYPHGTREPAIGF